MCASVAAEEFRRAAGHLPGAALCGLRRVGDQHFDPAVRKTAPAVGQARPGPLLRAIAAATLGQRDRDGLGDVACLPMLTQPAGMRRRPRVAHRKRAIPYTARRMTS